MVFFYVEEEISNIAFLTILPNYVRPIKVDKYTLKIIIGLFFSRNLLYDTSNYSRSINKVAKLQSINANWGIRDSAFQCPDDWILQMEIFFEKEKIDINRPYVCLHVRESGYSPKDEHFHSERNQDLLTYKMGIEYLLSQGYSVIRMGDKTMKKLPFEYDRLYDYARSELKVPLLDLAISSKCLFFIGGSSGAHYMATIFGRPSVSVNMALPFNFSPTGFEFDIGIPKLFANKNTGEFLKFSDIFSMKLDSIRDSQYFQNSIYSLIDNTEIEILEVIVEMNERLNRKWIQDEEVEKLQDIVNKLLPRGSYTFGTKSKCGANFLKKYNKLLC